MEKEKRHRAGSLPGMSQNCHTPRSRSTTEPELMQIEHAKLLLKLEKNHPDHFNALLKAYETANESLTSSVPVRSKEKKTLPKWLMLALGLANLIGDASLISYRLTDKPQDEQASFFDSPLRSAAAVSGIIAVMVVLTLTAIGLFNKKPLAQTNPLILALVLGLLVAQITGGISLATTAPSNAPFEKALAGLSIGEGLMTSVLALQQRLKIGYRSKDEVFGYKSWSTPKAAAPSRMFHAAFRESVEESAIAP